MPREDWKPDDGTVAAIKAELEAYETRRATEHRNLRWYTPLALIPAVIVAILGLMVLLAEGPPPVAKDDLQFGFWVLLAVALLGAGGILLAHGPSRKLQQSLRDRLLPSLFGFVGEVEYSHATKPFTFDYLPAAALPSYAQVTFGDVVRGRYRWMRFELYEMHLRSGGKNDKRVFDGVVVGFDIPGHFPGLLLATPRRATIMKLIRDIFGSKLSTLEAGNPALDAAFEFRSDNPAAAGPLVAGTLGAALEHIGGTWREGPPRLALSEQIGFLLMPTSRNFFELPGVGVTPSYERHIEPLVAELTHLLDTALVVRRAMAGREGAEEEPGLLD
jgi:hypothetical protein